MACLIDQELTFVDGEAEVSVADIDYSNYILTLGENTLSFAGKDEDISMFLAGGTLDSPVYPTVAVFPNGRLRAFTDQGETYEGTAYVTLCEKESDSDACPDVPFSESAPEKYADYFDEDGNFVPKGNPGGGGDCDVTLATLTLKTSGGNEQYSGSNDFVSLITSGGETYFAYNSDSNTGNYVIPLYKGSTIINFSLFDQSTEIEVESGDIELMSHEEDYWSYKLTGDATLVLPYGGLN